MKVLIVSYFFPPYNTIASKRWDSMGTYLLDKADIRIFSPQGIGDLKQTFPERLVYRGKDIGDSRNRNTNLSQGSRWNNILKRLIGRTFAYMRTIDSTAFTWFWRNRKYFRNVLNEFCPDVVLVTVGPFSTAFFGVISKRISKNAIRVIVDIRDAQSLNDRNKKGFLKQKLDELLDKLIVRKFDSIITVSPTLATIFEKFYKKPIGIVMNGFSKSPIRSIGTKIPLRKIYHAGQVYEHRLPALFLLIDVLRSKPDWECIIRYLGSPELKAKIQKKINAFKMHNVKLLDAASPQKVENEILEAGCLVLFEELSSNDTLSKGNLTAKLFEYLPFSVPILAICRKDSDIGLVLDKTGKGFVCDSEKDINQFLFKWEEWSVNAQKMNEVMHFHRSEQAKNAFELINKLSII